MKFKYKDKYSIINGEEPTVQDYIINAVFSTFMKVRSTSFKRANDARNRVWIHKRFKGDYEQG